MGWHAQHTAQVVFEGVRVPADAMLGGEDGEGTGFSIAMSGLNGGRINIAACSVGGARAAYDKAADYLCDRDTFGAKRRPISMSRPELSHPSQDLWLVGLGRYLALDPLT
jgi:alkylation response protein AidB-like acyl-CoA dehydrogenase